MVCYTVSKRFGWSVEVTDNVRAVCRMFGLTLERLSEESVNFDCRLEVKEGDIVYITGPSGSGKSVLLREIEKQVSASERVNLVDVELSSKRALIDCIDGDFFGALKMLSIAGLNDVFCILNQPANLSEGQQWRFRLAKSLGTGRKFIFADEFCTGLDRITASTVSYAVHRFAKHRKVTFILASSHGDILADLEPDVIVRRDLCGNTEVSYKGRRG